MDEHDEIPARCRQHADKLAEIEKHHVEVARLVSGYNGYRGLIRDLDGHERRISTLEADMTAQKGSMTVWFMVIIASMAVVTFASAFLAVTLASGRT